VRDYGNGVQGYSAMPHYNNAMQLFQQHAPGQYDAIRAQFINPRTGAPPVSRAALTNDQRAELGIGQSDDMTDIEMDGTSGDGTSVDGTSNGTGFGYDGGVVGDVAFGDGTGEFGLPDPFGGPLGDAADAVGDATGLWKGRNYRRLKRGGMW